RWPMWRGPMPSMPPRSAAWQPQALWSKARPATCGEAGATPLELARVCKAWRAFPPALLTRARVRLRHLSPIGDRRNRPAAAKKCSQLFPVEHEGGGGGKTLRRERDREAARLCTLYATSAPGDLEQCR